MDLPPCLARADIAPLKPNSNGRVYAKTQQKAWLTKALQQEINPKHYEESEALPLPLYFFDALSRSFLFDLIHMTLIPLLIFT
jgi:hypothetical protein